MVAVNVTSPYSQTGMAGLLVMVMVGVTLAFTVLEMLLLVAVVVVAQGELLVSTQVTASPVASVVVV